MWQRTGGRHYPHHLRAESSGQKRQVPRSCRGGPDGIQRGFRPWQVPGRDVPEHALFALMAPMGKV